MQPPEVQDAMNAEPIPGTAWTQARSRQSLGELLVQLRCLGAESLSRAQLVQQETGEPLVAVLTRLGLVSDAMLADALSIAFALPLVQAQDFPQQPVSLPDVQPRFLREARLVPVENADGMLRCACVDPSDTFAVEALHFATGRPVAMLVARAGDVDAALERLYPAITAAGDNGDDLADEADLERLKDLASDAPVIRAVNRLIARAVDARASDIHVEPAEDRLVVRLRVDGALAEIEPLPSAMKLALVSRIKIMAGLNIAEKRLPQDGRLRIAVRGNDIDLRVATAPGIHGESVVMRILDRSNLSLDFGTLGFDAAERERIEPMLRRPHGIVLVTGPTGSGKTTTLYTALSSINEVRSKILTIEDPIEYRLPGIVQAQVNSAIGLSFASALRSFLRQDPDIIMVGEIRDLETATVAVQAALTGHLILSTLHTNSAAAAVARLIDMGIEPFLIASTLNAVLAQRLVRRLCPQCRQPHVPDKRLLAAIGWRGKAPAKLYSPGGCASCNNSGFKGRIALLELLELDETLAPLVMERAEARLIQDRAVAGGMRTMMEDGLVKAAAGLTTLDEVLRVTREG